jgi:hypothetical protein
MAKIAKSPLQAGKRSKKFQRSGFLKEGEINSGKIRAFVARQACRGVVALHFGVSQQQLGDLVPRLGNWLGANHIIGGAASPAGGVCVIRFP